MIERQDRGLHYSQFDLRRNSYSGDSTTRELQLGTYPIRGN